MQCAWTRKLTVNIPIEFVGEAPAEKPASPSSRFLMRLEVETLPGNMPHKFIVDLSVLDEIGKSIHIKDIKVPRGVEMLLAEDGHRNGGREGRRRSG